MEDNDKITLRDKIVISLLEGYLNDNSNKNDVEIKKALLNPDEHKHLIHALENRIRAAYKMADLVRKIRLESFT